MVVDEASYEVADRTFLNAWDLLHASISIIPVDTELLPLYLEPKSDGFDPRREFDSMSHKDKEASNVSLFTALSSDMLAIVRARPGFPVRDTFLTGWETMHKTRKPLFYSAFALQMYLDIAHIMGRDVDRGLGVLMEQVATIEEEIHVNLEFRKKYRLGVPGDKTDEESRWILDSIRDLRSDRWVV